MIMGGNAMIDGRMTVGEFLNYILFTGLMAAPVMQIASIGTQISEAFAGLDRIHELMAMRTEDDEDKTRAPLGQIQDVAPRGIVNGRFLVRMPPARVSGTSTPARPSVASSAPP
mgnify:CR=1 FL=1